MCLYKGLYLRGTYAVTFSETNKEQNKLQYRDTILYCLIYEKDKIFIFKTCKHKCFFLPLVVLSIPSVVVGLDSVLCDDSSVLWTVVWVLLYVLSVTVVVVMSIVRNKQ